MNKDISFNILIYIQCQMLILLILVCVSQLSVVILYIYNLMGNIKWQLCRCYLIIDLTICTYNCLKNPYTVKLHSNMYQWRPPPSSGKSTSTNQTTFVLSCLSYHARRFTLINAELAKYRSEAVKHHGN
jgi:hypothetical protein